MSRFSQDRIPEDESVFDIDGFFAYDEGREQRPQKREPENPHCANCPDRFVVPDGYSGWVHEDNYLYSCELDPRARKTSTYFASARLT